MRPAGERKTLNDAVISFLVVLLLAEQCLCRFAIWLYPVETQLGGYRQDGLFTHDVATLLPSASAQLLEQHVATTYSGNSPRTRATYCFRTVLVRSWFIMSSAACPFFAMNMSPLVNRSRRLHAIRSQPNSPSYTSSCIPRNTYVTEGSQVSHVSESL